MLAGIVKLELTLQGTSDRIKMMDLKQLAAKLTSSALIILGSYQILLSITAIFFVYPYLYPYGREAIIIQEGLIEKGLILYASMVVSGIYGVLLLFKPTEKVKIIHLLAGILIFIVSLFFVTQTPFTTDPLQQFLFNLIGAK